MTTRDEVTGLADMARWCFSKSLDARVDAAKRAELLVLGERINERVGRLATKRFDEGKGEFAEAHAELKATIASVKKRQDDLDALEGTLAKVAAVIGAVDKLLGVVL